MKQEGGDEHHDDTEAHVMKCTVMVFWTLLCLLYSPMSSPLRTQMAGSQITSFIFISFFLGQAHSADNISSEVMPQTVTPLTGSCVQIPCTFTFSNFHIKITGELNVRNCTTVFYNVTINHSDRYYFRLEMVPDVFRPTFNPHTADSSDSSKTVKIIVRASPQPPELKLSELQYVMQENTVNLSCSAEAPCPTQPPNISWSNIPESASITTQLQEKPDKTQSVFSYMTFKASYKDHRKNITCTATYPRNTPNDSTVEGNIMLRVLFPPKETHISISPSVGTNVTLTCKSKASPANDLNYTWYKCGEETPIAWGKKINLTRTQTASYFCTAQNKHGKQSSEDVQLTDEGEDGHTMPMIAGCVGGIVAVLTLSAFGFCIRTKTFNKSSLSRKDPSCWVNNTDVDYVNIARDMINEWITFDDEYTEIEYTQLC
uniref:Si:dkeyp-28d2.4 n=2 Tax=Cyprinus carpio TaxID=7962 RepID=A0A8C1ATM3_CYPCA